MAFRTRLPLIALACVVTAASAERNDAWDQLRPLLEQASPPAVFEAPFVQQLTSPLLRGTETSTGRFRRDADAMVWVTDTPTATTTRIDYTARTVTLTDHATGTVETHPFEPDPLMAALLTLDAEQIAAAADLEAFDHRPDADELAVTLRPHDSATLTAMAVTLDLQRHVPTKLRLTHADATETRIRFMTPDESMPSEQH